MINLKKKLQLDYLNNFKNIVKKLDYSVSKKKNKNKILIEFNGFSSGHIVLGLFLKAIKSFYNNSEVVAFPGYIVDQDKLKKTFLKKILWKFCIFFKIKTFHIYHLLGVSKIIWPNIHITDEDESKKKAYLLLKKIHKINDLEKLKVNNIFIGDLIYDGYLKKFQKHTIDLTEKQFINFFTDAITLFDYWIKYFKNNNIKTVVCFHSVYLCALPIRIAIAKNIKSYSVSLEKIYSLSKKNYLPSQEHLFFKYQKKKIPYKQLQKGVKIAKREMNERFSGNLISSMLYLSKSPYGKITKKKVIKKTKKIKILIAPHALSDSPHALGIHFFPDYYLWIKDLIKIKKITNYDWYVKIHPNMNYYNDQTEQVIKEISKKNGIHFLNPSTSHKQIIKEGINFAITVHGNIGLEYPLFGVPVINASKNGPHKYCNFNINPKSKSEYKRILLNLKKVKKPKINSNELYQYYFMKFIYNNNNWLIDDYNKAFQAVYGINGLYNPIFYKYFDTNYDSRKLSTKVNMIKKFIKSGQYSICNNDVINNLKLNLNKKIY